MKRTVFDCDNPGCTAKALLSEERVEIRYCTGHQPETNDDLFTSHDLCLKCAAQAFVGFLAELPATRSEEWAKRWKLKGHTS